MPRARWSAATLVPIVLWVACAEPPQALGWRGPPVPVGPSPVDQHHATLAIGADGRTLVAHSADRAVGVRLLDEGFAERWLEVVPAWTHHPQVAAVPGGYVVAVNATPEAGPVLGRAYDDVGAVGGVVTWTADGHYPDLDVAGDRGVVVWSEADRLAGRVFDGTLEAAHPVEGPPAAGGVDPPSVRFGGGRAWAVWSDAAADVAVIRLHEVFDDGALSESIEIARAEGAGSGRATVAPRDDGPITVAWRWLDKRAGTPLGGWARTLDVDGAPLGPALALGDRPVVAVAGACAVLAWEDDGAGFVALVGPVGELIDGPRSVGAPATAQRLYVDAREVGGELVGVVSWEGTDGRADRDVWVRGFVIGADRC